MEFDKLKVYTALNAEKLKVGSRCIFADTVQALCEKVESDDAQQYVHVLTDIRGDGEAERFEEDDYIAHVLAYLIEPPAGSKYKPFESIDKAMEAIKAHGGWVENRNSRTQYIVTAKDREYGLFLLGYHWYSLGELFQRFIFADDGTTCGEVEGE